ncbi:hypothetical protein HK407_09g13770 [Ordospora pajunii]|uniref:uncharacterized protein n=1 Tax=Ordospora pajunii TaxID=3039483 RepID=UPI0029528066|nr:uncharacterized protein HK407_09g13770 [Ordospora pajunii]KAH9410963.1 hypothetical protein HK407_09g13770 [Ordospora pajunii]
MTNRFIAFTISISYIVSVICVAIGKHVAPFQLIAYLPLVFLNFLLTMLLVLAGKHLYLNN